MGKELGIFEIKKFSADELLKTKPKTIECLQPVQDEPNNFNIDINGVIVHGVRKHEIKYSANGIFVKFLDQHNNRLATIDVVGSSEYKKNEFLYVGYGKVYSGTNLRVCIDNIEINELTNVGISK